MRLSSKVIFGTFSFLGIFAGFIGLVIVPFQVPMEKYVIEVVFLWFGTFIPFVATLVYLFQTKFWVNPPSLYEKIEQENQIIKKQIEQKELKLQLSKLDILVPEE